MRSIRRKQAGDVQIWYDFLKKKCSEIKVIYMDTDSFIFEVINQTYNEIMLEHREHFDLRNFSKDSKYYDSSNKKVPGKMKDVYPGKNINKVIAIKSKSYIVITSDNQEECKHNGHNYNFTGNEYKDVIFNKKVLKHPMKKILSLRHKLYSEECIKKTLRKFCEKRYLHIDGINTHALGHKNTFKKINIITFFKIYKNGNCRYY